MDNNNLLAELLVLSSEKEIPYSVAQLRKMSHERLEQVMEDYKRKELDSVNETIADVLIIKFEEFMKSTSYIKAESKLAKKLNERRLFKRDLKNIVSYITPILPFVGLFEGGIVVASEIFDNLNKNEDNLNKNEDTTHETSQGEQHDPSTTGSSDNISE